MSKKYRKLTTNDQIKRKLIINITLVIVCIIGIGYAYLNTNVGVTGEIAVSRLKVTCEDGTYLAHASKVCSACTAGYYCPGNTFSYDALNNQGIISCPIGSYSGVNATSCSVCINGKTTSEVGSSSCDVDCSNNLGVSTWISPTLENNIVNDLCIIDICREGYTKNDNSCVANTYQVTLNNEGATTAGSESVEVTFENGVPTITPPTKRGYDFDGYYSETNGGGTKYINSDGTGTKDWDIISGVELHANWTVITITCGAGEYLPADATSCSSCPEGSGCPGGDYNYNATTPQGSNLCQPGTYSTGGAATCSICQGGATSVAGQTSCDSACSNAAHVSTWSNSCNIATCDTGYENVSNVCTARTFTVTLNNQGADVAGSTSVTTTYNASVPSITIPEKTGYTFGGYYTEANGAGVQYIKDDGTSFQDWDVVNVTELFAKWTIITRTCSSGEYLPQSSTTCSTCSAGSFCTGGSYSYDTTQDQGITACAVGSFSAVGQSSCTMCTGNTTSGVGQTSCNANCSNKANVSTWNTASWNNNTPTGICSIKTCNTGYSVSSNTCQANTYTITLNNQSATTAGSTSVTATYASAVPSITVPSKTGYTFGGYYTEEDGAGTQYINASGTSARNWDSTTITTLYAKWTIISKTCGAGQYLPKNSTTCTDCTTGNYCPGGTYSYNTSNNQGITACAAGTYTNATKQSSCTACGSGKTTSGTGKTSCDSDCSNKANASTWNTASWNNNSPTGICSIKTCNTGYSVNNNTCKGNTYTVTLNNQSATTAGSTSVTATYGSAIPSITKPAKTGYDFGGYYTSTNGGGTQYINASGTSTRNWDSTTITTLYAKWTIISRNCSAGQYLAKNSTSCSGCPAGSYCPGGTYTYSTTGDQGKAACAQGSYSAANSSTCTACTGKTTSGTGQTSCNATCSNETGAATWTTATWSANSVTNLCTISSCASEYSKSSNTCIYDWSKFVTGVKNKTIGVGQTRSIDLGSFGSHTLRVANNTTPSECSTTGFSQTACGFVLEFADIITEHRMNPYTDGSTNGDGNTGGWKYSEMRTYVNSDIYNALPSTLKNAIINTTVVSGHGWNDSANFTTTDKLYLLSTKEVWGKEGTSSVIKYDAAEAETRQLDYYKNNNVTTSNYSGAIKQRNSSNSYWWLRSALSSGFYSFFNVANRGIWSHDNTSKTYGVSPAFRIG